MGEAFHVELPVRFADVDWARVAYFPRILDMLHVAMEELFAKGVGRSYAAMITAEKLGFPTVHLDVDFRKPLRFGDLADVAITVARMGERSLVLRYEVTVQGQLCVRALQTTVAIDPEAFAPAPIPADYRAALERFLVPEGA